MSGIRECGSLDLGGGGVESIVSFGYTGPQGLGQVVLTCTDECVLGKNQ